MYTHGGHECGKIIMQLKGWKKMGKEENIVSHEVIKQELLIVISNFKFLKIYKYSIQCTSLTDPNEGRG